MIARLLHRLGATGHALVHGLQRRLRAATMPAAAPLVVGIAADLWRSKPERVAENVLLRQQLLILQRSVKRPRCTATDRAFLVPLTSRLRTQARRSAGMWTRSAEGRPDRVGGCGIMRLTDPLLSPWRSVP